MTLELSWEEIEALLDCVEFTIGELIDNPAHGIDIRVCVRLAQRLAVLADR